MGERDFGTFGRVFIFFFVLADVFLLMYLLNDKGGEFATVTISLFFICLACFFVSLFLFVLEKKGKLNRFIKPK